MYTGKGAVSNGPLFYVFAEGVAPLFFMQKVLDSGGGGVVYAVSKSGLNRGGNDEV